MKKKIMALIMALSMAGYVSAIDVNDNLSINGFIDASYGNSEVGGVDSQRLGIDEVEVNFLFNAGGVSAELHLDDGPDSANNGGVGGSVDIEQVFMSYALESGLTITLGQYASGLGLEREDPGGLYTVSRAYGNAFNYGDVDGRGAAAGVTLSYAADAYSIAASFENPVSAELDTNDLDLEVSISYTGIENLAIGGGIFVDNSAAGTAETDSINVHAAYNAGKALVGLEWSQNDVEAVETDAYLVLIDYDVSDKLGVALRYSSEEVGTGDRDKFTIAPNYSITESLGAILEYSDVDDSTSGDDDEVIALELTFSF